ncbi:MAG: tRNA pseudouridine65 synthase [Myxococcota bacterium]
MTEPTTIVRDGSLWVFNKPAGMPVHAAQGLDDIDLITWARAQGANVSPAHRLDRHTSGVVICSESQSERAKFGRWFADGAIHKEYQALVYGRAPAGGTIDRALNDGRRGRPLDAVTDYECLGSFARFTWLQVTPRTGRKHQIRRHLRGIGHAVVGDDRYGPGRRYPVPGFPGRMWLHAHKLMLPDDRIFEAPLPPELQTHLELLQRGGIAPADWD